MAKNKKIRRRYYPKRMYRRFKKGKQPIPILPSLAIANGALISPLLGDSSHGINGAINFFNANDYQGGAKEFMDIIGINFLGTKFSDGSRTTAWTDCMVRNYTTIAAAVIGHKVANMVGLNKQMRRIPFVGKYVSL